MLHFFTSTVGRKYLMGLSGLVWMGFIMGHMAGNMLIFVSADAFNAYGHAIVSNKILLYGTEIVLVLALIVHVITAISLTRENKSARNTRYAMTPNNEKKAVWASRFMGVQGSVILAFIIIHLITFKYGKYYETTVDGVVMRDLYRMVVEAFQNPTYTLWYLVALCLLLIHLSHGAASVFQSFGVLERKMQANIKKGAWAYAIVVAGGFISQPLYVFFFHR